MDRAAAAIFRRSMDRLQGRVSVGSLAAAAAAAASTCWLRTWTVKAEYLYYDLGSVTYALPAIVQTDLRDRVSHTASAASNKASGYATALAENASAISGRTSDYVSSLSDQAAPLPP
jgi:hypothetical protein